MHFEELMFLVFYNKLKAWVPPKGPLPVMWSYTDHEALLKPNCPRDRRLSYWMLVHPRPGVSVAYPVRRAKGVCYAIL